MEKKIVFRRLDASKYENCALMPAGAIEEEGVTASPTTGVTPLPDMSGWTASPVTFRADLPQVTFPEVEVGLEAAELSRREFSLSVKCKNAAPVEVVKVLAGTATDVPTAIRQEVTETVGQLVKTEVKGFCEAADKGFYFLGPFRLALRLRLSDGTLCTLPAPRLMLPNTVPLQVGIVSAAVRDDSALVRCVILLQPSRICLRVHDAGSFSRNVSALELLATSPATLWNADAEMRLSFFSTMPTTMAGTLTDSGLLTDVSPSRSVYHDAALTRAFIFSGIPSPVESALSGSGGSWYKIGELAGIPAPSATWTRAALTAVSSLKSLFSGKALTLDFSASTVPVSGHVATVGERTVCVGPRLQLSAPSVCAASLARTYDSAGEPTGVLLTEILVKFTDGALISETLTGVRIADPSAGWLRDCLYPSPGATEIVAVYLDSTGAERNVGFRLVDAPESSSSVSSGLMYSLAPERLEAMRKNAVKWNGQTRDEARMLVDWQTEAGPVSCCAMRFVSPVGIPCGVARVLPGASSDSFPSLYLYGTEGIAVIKRNSVTGWKSEKIISAVKCDNARGIVEAGDSVFVLTRSGLLRLVNNTVLLLSLPVTGSGEESALVRLPHAQELVGMAAASAPQVSFAEGELR